MVDMIQLPYGGEDAQFNPDDLVSYIKDSCRGYIIQVYNLINHMIIARNFQFLGSYKKEALFW